MSARVPELSGKSTFFFPHEYLNKHKNLKIENSENYGFKKVIVNQT